MNIKKVIYNSVFTPIRFAENLVENPALILIYHRVADLENDPQQLAVKPDNFYRQIEHLRKNYNLLNIEEFTEILFSGKEFPPNCIMLTFDDGYADNYHNATPALESLETQSLFYITTSMIDSNTEIWWDSLEKIFMISKEIPPELSLEANSKQYFFDTSDKSLIEKTYNALHPILKYTRINERTKVMKRLTKWANTDLKARETQRFLTSEELKKMSESKSVVIGAHTHTHTPLSILTADEQLEDINTSVELIKEITGKKVEHFSYPFGLKKDYNNDTIKICKEIGFRFVCANYYSQVHSWTDPYQLPRILIRDWNFEKFKENIDKFFKY